ncbi:MAG: calcium-binding protein [Pirellulaceae bacterium]
MSLEDRRCLTTVYFDNTAFTLRIVGDATAETVVVNELLSSQIEVVTTSNTYTFDSTSIYLIDAQLYGGDDQFTNNTSINCNVVGHSGNDTLIGGTGDDTINGSSGNDIIWGGDGTDTLNGSTGDDEIHGGAGLDLILGYTGADTIYGDQGNDLIYGQQDGDIIDGGAGNDRIRGAGGNDWIQGGDGDDVIFGDTESDELHGGSGNDYMYGYLGDDLMYGDAGYDRMYGQDGADEMYGGLGGDIVRGGNDNDILYGEDGADRVLGDAGDDLLRGGNHDDRLIGGSGMDSLFGGSSNDTDRMEGGGDGDWFLSQGSDQVLDLDATDANVNFVDQTSSWTNREIEVIDEAFQQLVAETGKTRLMRDSLDLNDLTFYKYADLNGSAGINSLSWTTSWEYINGSWVETTVYTREIKILDWDETSDWYNDAYRSVALHEIGHSWDSELEMTQLTSSLQPVWQDFLDKSSWTETNPNDSTNYSQSLDGQWWYSKSAAFAEIYGKTNPHEDWSTVWELYFDVDADTNLLNQMQDKLASINAFLSLV